MDCIRLAAGGIHAVFVLQRRVRAPSLASDQTIICSSEHLPLSSDDACVLGGWYVERCVLDAYEDLMRRVSAGAKQDFHLVLDLVDDDAAPVPPERDRGEELMRSYYDRSKRADKDVALYLDGILRRGEPSSAVHTWLHSSTDHFLRFLRPDQKPS